jgi:hypothetical protein
MELRGTRLIARAGGGSAVVELSQPSAPPTAHRGVSSIGVRPARLDDDETDGQAVAATGAQPRGSGVESVLPRDKRRHPESHFMGARLNRQLRPHVAAPSLTLSARGE